MHTYKLVCMTVVTIVGVLVFASASAFAASLETPEKAPASDILATTAVLHGVLNPASSRDTEPGSYEFLYRQSPTECDDGLPEEDKTTPEIMPPLGHEKEAVEAPVGELLPNTQYTYCLRATDEAGEETVGPPETFTTQSEAPSANDVSVSHLGTVGASLSVEINPGGLQTTYSVQYGNTTAYGTETTTAKLSPVVSTVSVPLAGLQPNTEYHFRFVLGNSDGRVIGQDETLTTYPPEVLGLPDGRVYEQVSNFGIADAEVYLPSVSPDYSIFAGGEHAFESSAEGNAVAFAGSPSTGGSGSGGNGLGNQYVASRLPGGGWQQVNTSPDSFTGEGVGSFVPFSSDLSLEVVRTRALPPFVTAEEPRSGQTTAEEAAEYEVLYSRSSSGHSYNPLFTAIPHRSPEEFAANAAGLSADATYVLFSANDALLEGTGSLEKELEGDVEKEIKIVSEVIGLEEKIKEVNEEYLKLQQEGDNAQDNREYAKEQELRKEAEVKKDEEGKITSEINALKVMDSQNELYVSANGRLGLVNISPEGKVVPGAAFGRSHMILRDGSIIFWTDLGTGVVYVREDDSITVPVSLGEAEFATASSDGQYAFYIETGKLWRFDVENKSRIELAGSDGGVQSVLGTNEAGEDGAYVYFVAQEILTDQGNGSGAKAVTGEDNLYALEPDPEVAAGSRIVFVATLSGVPTAYMTPDGQTLVFSSTLNLTGHSYPDEGSEEVYVYDTSDSSLFCASCRAQASGGNLISGHRWASENGDQVFFDSEEPLVAQDVNGTRDVYEWERNGNGTCRKADGCVYLLSNGIEGQATLIDASTSGNDVFIATRQRLIAEGQNEEMELYDARTDGVLPVTAPVCTGTGCQGVPASAPIFATPATMTFNGVGDFPAPGKPKVRSGGKTKSSSRTQKLARALTVCRKKHDQRTRAVCETKARRHYGVKSRHQEEQAKGG